MENLILPVKKWRLREKEEFVQKHPVKWQSWIEKQVDLILQPVVCLPLSVGIEWQTRPKCFKWALLC